MNKVGLQSVNSPKTSISFSGRSFRSELRELKKLSKKNLGKRNNFGPNLLTFSKEKIEKRAKLAKLSYETCLDFKKLGYEPPKIVIDGILQRFFHAIKLNSKDTVGFTTPLAPRKIFLSSEMGLDSEFPAHEIGHYLDYKNKGFKAYFDQNMNPKNGFTSGQDIMEKEISNVLMQDVKGLKESKAKKYAKYFSSDVSEFIAFYFQKAIHGHKFSGELNSIYKLCEGPEIKGVIPYRKLDVIL